MPPVDLCALAIQMGCGFVARSFSGDTKQVQALLKAAIAHNGTAVLDIISPCVTFNNHEGSTKSYPYAKAHEDPLHEIGFVPFFEETKVDYDPGTTEIVPLPDGSKITLTKLNHDYDPTDRVAAMQLLQKAESEQHFYTGLIYHDEHGATFDAQMNMIDEPLATLPAERLRPSNAVFEKIMEAFK
jgi:2-oxoglutarate/2-oxoacid ferredoxin oxidoreductase subunit beta